MKRSSLLSWGLSVVATIVWAVAVVASGMSGRIVHHWEAAATMLFGSFLAGSSPEGGGAVAFPVFTKGLGVPAPVARTFGLSIQAVGMTVALVAVLVAKRPIHVRATVAGSVSAVAGFAVAVAAWGKPDDVFWPNSISTAWIKATFSIVLATTSFLMIRFIRSGGEGKPPLVWTARLDLGVVLVAFVGGLLSALTGTGANIALFLFLVVLAGVDPRVALPSAMTVMAVVSVVGFVLFAVIDGQMAMTIVGDRVVEVGGAAVDLPAAQNDLFGMWLAAVPIVVWGAPLGSFIASLVEESHLAAFVAFLAATEVVSTLILVPELRTELALILYMGLGLSILPGSLVLLQRHRIRVFRSSEVAPG